MVTGLELVAGYLLAWAVRKARRVGQRADAKVDQALDAGMDRLHELVTGKLGNDPALEQLHREAEEGTANPLTQQRVELSVRHAAEQDQVFAGRLQALLDELRAQAPSGPVIIKVDAHDQAQVPVLGQGTQVNNFDAGGANQL